MKYFQEEYTMFFRFFGICCFISIFAPLLGNDALKAFDSHHHKKGSWQRGLRDTVQQWNSEDSLKIGSAQSFSMARSAPERYILTKDNTINHKKLLQESIHTTSPHADLRYNSQEGHFVINERGGGVYLITASATGLADEALASRMELGHVDARLSVVRQGPANQGESTIAMIPFLLSITREQGGRYITASGTIQATLLPGERLSLVLHLEDKGLLSEEALTLGSTETGAMLSLLKITPLGGVLMSQESARLE